MRVLVCGGRDFDDRELLFATLDRVHAKHGDALVIIHGAYKGADLLGERWAKVREVPYCGVPARWLRLGGAAGPDRNQRMRNEFNPQACVSFPGGRGTRNMCELMREIGIEPWYVGWAG